MCADVCWWDCTGRSGLARYHSKTLVGRRVSVGLRLWLSGRSQSFVARCMFVGPRWEFQGGSLPLENTCRQTCVDVLRSKMFCVFFFKFRRNCRFVPNRLWDSIYHKHMIRHFFETYLDTYTKISAPPSFAQMATTPVERWNNLPGEQKKRVQIFLAPREATSSGRA